MKKSLLVAVLAVSSFASVSAFADAGDRVDQVFPSQVTVYGSPAVTPSADANDVLPACFVNPYCGGA